MDFYTLILYSTALLKGFIRSKCFLVESLEPGKQKDHVICK